jgi:hypothetical protein
MSGVAGAERVKSRTDYKKFVASYQQLIKQFPGFVSIQPSGSFNSNLKKKDFGDIDLITYIQSSKDKPMVKKELITFFEKQPNTLIVPFSSMKHTGKRTYNSGEIVTIRYHNNVLGYSAQIDNIVALNYDEAIFKQKFLDMPAPVQGLVLGIVKVATIETNPATLFKNLGIKVPLSINKDQEYEFNLSSAGIQLRKVTFLPNTFKEITREIVWSSTTYSDLQTILYQYHLDTNFSQLLEKIKQNIKNPRSSNRIKGIFSSMITVKSGEIGTAKGDEKVEATNQVNQLLSEINCA